MAQQLDLLELRLRRTLIRDVLMKREPTDNGAVGSRVTGRTRTRYSRPLTGLL